MVIALVTHVVVVCVAHGPAGGVLLGVLRVGSVYPLEITVRPLLERAVSHHLSAKGRQLRMVKGVTQCWQEGSLSRLRMVIFRLTKIWSPMWPIILEVTRPIGDIFSPNFVSLIFS